MMLTSKGLAEFRQRQRDRIGKWVPKEVLNHIVFDGGSLYQRLEWVNSQAEADYLLKNYTERMRKLPDLAPDEKVLLTLLENLERR